MCHDGNNDRNDNDQNADVKESLHNRILMWEVTRTRPTAPASQVRLVALCRTIRPPRAHHREDEKRENDADDEPEPVNTHDYLSVDFEPAKSALDQKNENDSGQCDHTGDMMHLNGIAAISVAHVSQPDVVSNRDIISQHGQRTGRAERTGQLQPC